MSDPVKPESFWTPNRVLFTGLFGMTVVGILLMQAVDAVGQMVEGEREHLERSPENWRWPRLPR